MKIEKLTLFKACLTLIVVFSFLSISHPTNAVVTNEKAVKTKTPVNKAKNTKNNTKNTPPPEAKYVPGQIIIKFKDDAPVGSFAEDLVDVNQSTLKDVTGDDGLDRINRRHKVRAFKRVFGQNENAKLERKALRAKFGGKFTREQAKNIHKKARELYQDKFKQRHARNCPVFS